MRTLVLRIHTNRGKFINEDCSSKSFIASLVKQKEYPKAEFRHRHRLDLCCARFRSSQPCVRARPQYSPSSMIVSVSLRVSFESWKISIGYGCARPKKMIERSEPICAKAQSKIKFRCDRHALSGTEKEILC